MLLYRNFAVIFCPLKNNLQNNSAKFLLELYYSNRNFAGNLGFSPKFFTNFFASGSMWFFSFRGAAKFRGCEIFTCLVKSIFCPICPSTNLPVPQYCIGLASTRASINYDNKVSFWVAAIAPWFRLLLPSCGPGPRFESHAHHLFNLYYWNCIKKITKINKERLGLAHFFLKKSFNKRATTYKI